MAAAALQATVYRDGARAERRIAGVASTLRAEDQVALDATVEDLSVTGFRGRVVADLPVQSVISVGLSGIGIRLARVVRRDHDQFGCAFLNPLSLAELERALTASTVVAADFPTSASATVAYRPTLSLRTRVLSVIGITALLWAGLLAAVSLAVR